MCLGVPMRVRSIEGRRARCEAWGIEREVSLFLLEGEPVVPGDHVLVHVGYAIRRLGLEDAAAARDFWDLLGHPPEGAGEDRAERGRGPAAGFGTSEATGAR